MIGSYYTRSTIVAGINLTGTLFALILAGVICQIPINDHYIGKYGDYKLYAEGIGKTLGLMFVMSALPMLIGKIDAIIAIRKKLPKFLFFRSFFIAVAAANILYTLTYLLFESRPIFDSSILDAATDFVNNQHVFQYFMIPIVIMNAFYCGALGLLDLLDIH